jgi:hypothetical protein
VSMERLLIYPDSHIWDALYDQHVDPKPIIDSLAARKSTLVLSYHVVFEIAKIFLSLHPGREVRGIALFSYLKQFLDIGIPETKQLPGGNYEEDRRLHAADSRNLIVE